MFDDSSKRSRAIRAALDLAVQRDWNTIALADIAKEAGLSLAALRRKFTSKSDILRAFQKEVDAEVLKGVKKIDPSQTPRDRLFDLIMTRFELLGPYKPALKRIARDFRCHPSEAASLLCSTLISQYWMLAGAGARMHRPGAGLRVAGLAAIYAKTMRVWFEDDSEGLDRTMAALDRKLSKGEKLLARMDSACQDLRRFACGFVSRSSRRPSSEPPAASPAM